MKRLFILFTFLSLLNHIFSSEQMSNKEQEEARERDFDYHGGAAAQDESDYEEDFEVLEIDELPKKLKEIFFVRDPEVGEVIIDTDLMLAIFKSDLLAVREAIKNDNNPNGIVPIEHYQQAQSDYMLPLKVAVLKKQKDIVEALLKSGADRDIIDSYGKTALDYAKEKNYKEIADLIQNFPLTPMVNKWKLLRYHLPGGKLAIAVHRGYDPDTEFYPPKKSRRIFLGIKFDSFNEFKKGMQAGENVNSKTELGITPLMEASKLGKSLFVKELLKKGANPLLQDKEGNTALIWAVRSNQPNIVRILLEHGAATNLKNTKNKTYLDYAKEKPAVMEAINQFRNEVGQRVHETTIKPGVQEIPKAIATNIIAQYLG